MGLAIALLDLFEDRHQKAITVPGVSVPKRVLTVLAPTKHRLFWECGEHGLELIVPDGEYSNVNCGLVQTVTCLVALLPAAFSLSRPSPFVTDTAASQSPPTQRSRLNVAAGAPAA